MPRSTTSDDERGAYPIDEASHPERILSIDSLMAAENRDLVTFRKPFDLSQDIELEALRQELGPEANIPDTDGVVYLFYITPEAQRRNPKFKPVPVVLPEGHVKAVMLGIGLARDLEAAQDLLYRAGLLPLHDPIAGQQ